MKRKIALLMVVLLLSGLVLGCSSAQSEKQAETPAQQNGFNPQLLEVLGQTYSEIKTVYGPADGAVWILGTAFYFPETERYFCFIGEDDLSVKEPAEDAVCHAVNASLSDFVFGMEENREYSVEELQQHMGMEIKEHGLSDMDSVYVYSVTYEGHEVMFETPEENVLAADSFAYSIERME